MGTIDQPKPTQPGSPVPDQQPIQPGATTDSRLNSAPSTRSNPQTPEIVKEENPEAEEHRGRR